MANSCINTEFLVAFTAEMGKDGSKVNIKRLDNGQRWVIPYNFVHNTAASQAKVWLESTFPCEVRSYASAGANKGYILSVKFSS